MPPSPSDWRFDDPPNVAVLSVPYDAGDGQ